jgi:GlpG protein
MRRHWNRPLTQRAPLVVALIGLSCFASLATSFGRNRQSPLWNALVFGDARSAIYYPDGSVQNEPLAGIKRGELWRMVTPIFLHGELHLLFNMYWVYVLGVQLESRLGTVRFGALVLVLALISNWAQYLITDRPNFMGMSGVVYGMFGYMWLKLRLDPRSGYLMGEATVFIMLLVLVLGFTQVLPNIANFAHLGGLLAGMAVAYATSLKG